MTKNHKMNAFPRIISVSLLICLLLTNFLSGGEVYAKASSSYSLDLSHRDDVNFMTQAEPARITERAENQTEKTESDLPSILTQTPDTKHVISNIDGFSYNQLKLYSVYALVRQITPYGMYDYLSAGAEEAVEVGSITQLMTYLVLMDYFQENGLRYNSTIQITEEDIVKAKTADITNLGLKSGDTFAVKDLVHAMLMMGGGEAIYALVRSATPTEKAFVQAMNVKAEALGMTKTIYSNPIGYKDPTQPSATCLEDVAKLLQALTQDPKFMDAAAAKTYQTEPTESNPQGYVFSSIKESYAEARQLKTDSIGGGKTGSTKDSGYSFASYNVVGNSIFLVLTARAKEKGQEIADHIKLRETMQKIPYTYPMLRAGDVLGEIPVYEDGKENFRVDVTAANDASIALPIWSDLGSYILDIQAGVKVDGTSDDAVKVGQYRILNVVSENREESHKIDESYQDLLAIPNAEYAKEPVPTTEPTTETRAQETTEEKSTEVATTSSKSEETVKNAGAPTWTIILVLLVIAIPVGYIVLRQRKIAEARRRKRLKELETRYKNRKRW